MHRKHESDFEHHKAAAKMTGSYKHIELDANISDSSVEEDVKDASAAPVPDSGITYSFDAPHGPGQGSGILSMAINKAVERFETKVTEKLVKDEYEIVRKDNEVGHTVVEDDFELI